MRKINVCVRVCMVLEKNIIYYLRKTDLLDEIGANFKAQGGAKDLNDVQA